ncbi:hypothetical protein AX15_000968 [Amanita polypyramis BW_CC]|nr:hypothetical protein AX15_000968 [Amanita polypyramis BW_CC]
MGVTASRVAGRAIKFKTTSTAEPHKPSSIPSNSVPPRSPVIERDTQNPSFITSLRQLGPVDVNHSIHPSPQSSKHLSHRTPHSRTQSELTSSISMRSPTVLVPVHGLYEILDKHKSVRSHPKLGAPAERYGIDQELLDQLANLVNSPSVRVGVDMASGDLEERPSKTALWIIPRL